MRCKPRQLEEGLQITCVTWFRWMYPKRMIFAIPNGGARNVVVAMKLKRGGVLPGVPDLFVPHASGGFNGLFLELKVGTNRQTKEQKAIAEQLSGEGYLVALCRSFEEFETTIREYVRKENAAE
jgi:hypothetical protein